VLLGGQEIRSRRINLPAHKISRMGVGYVPEGRLLLTRMTVYENLLMGAFFRANKPSRASIVKHIEREFERFPVLNGRRGQLAGTLSGGEQQMLAISRALMARPRLILLDEPSLGLAPLIKEMIFNIIEKLKEENVTVLLVEQDAMKALKVSQRGYVLELGEIKASGTSHELIENTEIAHIYLGG